MCVFFSFFFYLDNKKLYANTCIQAVVIKTLRFLARTEKSEGQMCREGGKKKKKKKAKNFRHAVIGPS